MNFKIYLTFTIFNSLNIFYLAVRKLYVNVCISKYNGTTCCLRNWSSVIVMGLIKNELNLIISLTLMNIY